MTVSSMQQASATVSGGLVKETPNGTSTATSRLGTLTTTAGKFDLTDNDLIVTNSSYTNIRSQIVAARTGGTWSGNGLTSSAAAARVPKNTTLGTLTGAELISLGQTTFDGFTVAPTDVLVKYTYYGDTDFSGIVDFDDYSRTDNGFNNHASTWFRGDFDYNGQVDFDDYSLIDLAFNTQSGTLRRAMSYLEGGDRSDSGMDAPALHMVMDHFDQFGQGYANSFLNAVPEPSSALALSGLVALAASKRRRRVR